MMRRIVLAFAVAAALSVAASPVASGDQPAAGIAKKKKKKKCAKGFKKSGKKCVRRTITPASITLVIATIKDHRVKFTGYSEFGKTTTADAFLSGKVVVADGIGSEKIKFNLFVAKGQNSTNFTANYKLGLNSPNMTVTLICNGVSSNTYAVAN